MAELLPAFDQPLVDGVVLIGAAGKDAPLDGLLEPCPLKHRGLEDRGRGIGIVFQQLRRPLSAEAEVEPAIEAALVALPALGEQRPEASRNLQPRQNPFVAERALDQLEAHRLDLRRRLLDVDLDLLQRERVVGTFVPVAFAVDLAEIEATIGRRLSPVVALGTGDPLHRFKVSAAGMAVAMPVTMSVEMRDRTAEASMDGAAVRPTVWPGHGFEPGAARPLSCKAHGDCANSGSPHHRQHHTARPLHGSHP
jgi:hypothetical protein